MQVKDIKAKGPGSIPRAIVLGTATTGIAVIRSLGRMGVPVIGVDKDALSVGNFSRYCSSVRSPDPEIDEEGYVRLLIEIGQAMADRPVLFTTRDRETAIVAKHKLELSEYFRVPVADYDLIAKLVDKRKFYELIRGLDIDFPATFVPENVDHVIRLSEKVPYPCIVKPVHSIPFSRQFGVKCFYADNAMDLVQGYRKAEIKGHDVIIQEVIPGEERCLYHLGGYYDKDSEPHGLFLQRKIRNCPEQFGIGSLAESCADPGIVHTGTKFMKDLGYHGIGVVEMKKDPRDGLYKVLEVNARPWTQLWLVTCSGMNLPYMAYCDAIGEQVEKVAGYREGLKWLCMSDDLLTCVSRARKGKLSIDGYIDSLWGPAVYSVLDFADPVPFLLSPVQLCNMSINYLSKRAGRVAIKKATPSA